MEEEQGHRFRDFKRRVIEFLKLDEETVRTLSFCWEVMFDIVEGEGDYQCDFEHMRLTSDFLLSAVLLSVFHDKRVALLEPTSYYSFQAIKMFKRWNINAPKLEIGPVGTLNDCDADVVFHHGRRFDCGIISKKARSVAQVFLNEDVPQDYRSLSTLVSIANYDN